MSEIKLSYINKTKTTKISNVEDAVGYCQNLYDKKTINLKEYFYVICLNRFNNVIGFYKLSEGSTHSSIVDIKHLLSCAILTNSSGVIITHNHPSGNKTPSKSDVLITNKIKSALKLIDVILIDHLIITNKSYYSFQENQN